MDITYALFVIILHRLYLVWYDYYNLTANEIILAYLCVYHLSATCGLTLSAGRATYLQSDVLSAALQTSRMRTPTC